MKVHATSRGGDVQHLDFESGESLMEVLAQADLVEATCGGACSCATCQVYVDATWLSKLPEQDTFEAELLEELVSTNELSRLACQIALTEQLDGLPVQVAPAE
ncbi:MAG: 2Fe-2S iron-sulfur cluster-binding protein [Oceanococcus sp.]